MISPNLNVLQAAIAELKNDLDWMQRLEQAILRGDDQARLKILSEMGFNDSDIQVQAQA